MLISEPTYHSIDRIQPGVANFTHLGKTFSCPSLGAEENRDFLLPIINLGLGLLDDQRLGRLDGPGLGAAGSAPDEDDDAADDDGH